MADFRRTLKPLLIYLALFFLVWTLRATVLFRFDAGIGSETWRHVYSNAVKFVVWVVPVFLYLRLYEGRAPLRYLKLDTPPKREGMARALLVAFVYFSVVLLAGVFVQGRRVVWGLSGVALASTVVSSLSEEIMFRGFVLRELSERARFWTANFVASALFALVHLPNWLWTRGAQAQVAADLAGVFALALLLGYLLRKTDTLWSCVAAHVLNNFLAMIMR